MTQLLNRLITISGESTVTEQIDTRFTYSCQGFIQIGYWRAYADGDFTSFLVDSEELRAALNSDDSGIVVLITYYLDGDMVAGVELPFPTTLDNEVPLTIRIHGPTDADYLEGVIADVFRSLGVDLISQVGWGLVTSGVFVQHGNVFPIGHNLTFSFVGRGQASPVSEATKQAWAALSERGADVGIVASEFTRGEGAQERIEARVRYDPSVAIGKEFTDDLGRRWFVSSTRTEGNRRWLVYEGSRLVSGIDLPEFGAGE